ncbi:MAG: triphosphoribosyl-dephospho-CoA synthase [Planctomycetes bacterium]|nr:triphosphoribosyl-dephospho-CoA synthase [Planctomycetota bacterium]
MARLNSGLSPGLCAQFACILEATAPKAGNVHRYQDFARTTYPDFLYSAAAIAPALEAAAGRGLGETILDAVERTRQVVRQNTNLGIVLLLAPLAAVFDEEDLPAALARKLDGATVRDAELVFQAIRLAGPRGLGEAAEEDVRGPPTRRLREVMALAAERDLVARQYQNGFEEVLRCGVPALGSGLADGLGLEEAIVLCHLTLLARYPDTLIARICGLEEARRVAAAARQVLDGGWPRGPEAQRRFEDFDRWLREGDNRRNPGATADLTAASLFIALRNGIIKLPL